MKPLLIKSVPNLLDVNFDPQNGTLELSGISIPENAKLFFTELKEWLENYTKTNPEKTEVNVKISYLNTGSQGFIVDLFKKLEPLHSSGKQILVKWYYEEDDKDIKEIGENCSQMTKIPFEIIPVESF